MKTKLGKCLLAALLVLGLFAPLFEQGVSVGVQPAGPKPGTTGAAPVQALMLV
jgi:hypothetical protein